MDCAEFDKMFEIEETHWWYRGRRALVSAWVERKFRECGPLRILDIASATGMAFRFLSAYGDVRGIDISEETIRLCKRRGIDRIIRGDATVLPFRDQSFDLILALDALEHFDDDLQAIEEICRVARPAALILITVPAFMFLWSAHDEAYHHVRRYTRSELGRKLRGRGLAVRKISYYSMTLLPAVFLMRKLRSWLGRKETPHSDFFLRLPRWIETLLSGVMQSELALMKTVDLPFGVSLFCAATPGKAGIDQKFP